MISLRCGLFVPLQDPALGLPASSYLSTVLCTSHPGRFDLHHPHHIYTNRLGCRSTHPGDLIRFTKMVEKQTDPEAPVLVQQEAQSTVSIEKEIGAEVAREWSRDPAKSVAAQTKPKNPLAELTQEELFRDVEQFAYEKELNDILELLKKGSLIAQDPKRFEELPELQEEEKIVLRREKTHRWSQPFMMYFMTSMCSLKTPFAREIVC